MGFGGISIWQLLIILVIVLLLFGTKRLKNIGSDILDFHIDVFAGFFGVLGLGLRADRRKRAADAG